MPAGKAAFFVSAVAATDGFTGAGRGSDAPAVEPAASICSGPGATGAGIELVISAGGSLGATASAGCANGGRRSIASVLSGLGWGATSAVGDGPPGPVLAGAFSEVGRADSP